MAERSLQRNVVDAVSTYLSRIDIFDSSPPVLKITVTQDFESIGYSREFHTEETLYGLEHDSVKDRNEYVEYMIEMLVRTLEADHAFEVEGVPLTKPELDNLMNRYHNREENPE